MATPVQHLDKISYRIHRQGPNWVVLCHSLGCCQDMWVAQVAKLSKFYSVLTYDLPGHGQSQSNERDGSLDHLAADLLGLLDWLEIRKARFIGISIGGMVGQVAALAQPERFLSLVLANTSSQMPASTYPDWQARITQARNHGVSSLAAPSLKRWFTPEFQRSHPNVIDRIADQFAQTSSAGYVECCEAIMGLSTVDRLPNLTVPTLVITGSADLSSSPTSARALQSRLGNATLSIIEEAGHLSCIDHPDEFTNLCMDFFQKSDRTPSNQHLQRSSS